MRLQIIKTDDIDTEAAFLQTLIPPKENATEDEETPKESEEITGDSNKVKKESPKKAEAATVNEKNVTEDIKEDIKEVDTESEVKIEKSDKDAEEVETESVDA